MKKIVTYIFLIFLIVGCSGGTTTKITTTDTLSADNAASDTTIATTDDGSVKSEVVNVNFILPSPDEILNEILPSKIDVNPQIINPKENSTKYLNAKAQALNLGVYIADFAYLNMSDNKTNALEYFKLIRDLSQKVGIYGFFNESIYNRVQSNLTRKDSLQAISKEIYYNMLGILESSNRNNIYALVSSGALIETMYLSSMVITNFESYKAIAEKIFEQKFVFDNFYEFAMQYRNDPDVVATMAHFDNLRKIIEHSTVKQTEKKVTIDKKDHFVIGGGDEFVVTESTFKQFKISITKTRQEITAVSKR